LKPSSDAIFDDDCSPPDKASKKIFGIYFGSSFNAGDSDFLSPLSPISPNTPSTAPTPSALFGSGDGQPSFASEISDLAQ